MINLLVGAPGGGKSYEAVVFHVLAALGKGRKVITNLALMVDAFRNIEPGYADLIELRTHTLGAAVGPHGKALNKAAFAQVEDYGDPWRHPTTGAGPLYVIDEAHIPLPKIGTPVAVEEWFALHRHEFADVLLISQSYGKLNQAIRDLLQVVYRVRKNIALGSSRTYTRKVQDGIRGSVVNTAVRRYEPKYFALYKSHTRSSAGIEMGAADIVPFWRHWSIYGLGLCAVVFVVMVMYSHPFSLFSPKAKAAGPVASGPIVLGAGAVASPVAAVVTPVQKEAWPYGPLELHVAGVGRMGKYTEVVISFSQNGQRVFDQSGVELQRAGYSVHLVNDCLVQLGYGKLSQFISCDAPRVGIGDSMRGVVHDSGTAAALPRSEEVKRPETPLEPSGEVAPADRKAAPNVTPPLQTVSRPVRKA